MIGWVVALELMFLSATLGALGMMLWLYFVLATGRRAIRPWAETLEKMRSLQRWV